MTYEQKDNTGSVFKNERKEKDTHPDRTGSATIGGVAYWVNGWVKQDKNGNQYLSLAFKPKETPRTAGRVDHQNERPKPRQSTRDELQDDVPF